MTASVAGQTTSQEFGTYEVKSDGLYIDGTKIDYIIDGQNMTISRDGITIKLKKK